jgi:tetratricopeptide (TPR) repeat protein
VGKGSLEGAGLAKQQSEPVTVESCYAAGLDALERGDLTKAQAWAQRCGALADSAKDARYAALQGRIAAVTGNFTEAENHFRTAMRLSPREKGFARQFVEFLQTAGRLNEAVALLEDLTRKDPPEADLLIDLGYVRLANGDRTGARKAVERAAASQPDNKAIQYSLAQMYAAIGQPAQAAKVLSEKFGDQASPRVLNELAGLLLQLERYDQAELTFRALGKRDSTAELMVDHGIIWSRIKRSDWRGALDVALNATRLDRHGVTTQFLTYAKDRLFRQPPNAPEREVELLQHLRDEMREYAELHASEAIVG